MYFISRRGLKGTDRIPCAANLGSLALVPSMPQLDNDLVPVVSHSLTHLADREIVRQRYRRCCVASLSCSSANSRCKVAASAVDFSSAGSHCSAVLLHVWESISGASLKQDAVSFYEGVMMSHIL